MLNKDNFCAVKFFPLLHIGCKVSLDEFRIWILKIIRICLIRSIQGPNSNSIEFDPGIIRNLVKSMMTENLIGSRFDGRICTIF